MRTERRPKISIIVPCYNVANELERCVNSILAQTYSELEIVLVDDGSCDSTACIMRDLAEKDERIVCVYKPNGGVTSARLAGIEKSTGAWLGFVDGDDEIEPEMYERLIGNAIGHNADISHCGYKMLFPDGRVNCFHNTGRLFEQDTERGMADLLDGSIVEPGLCNKLYRRKLFDGLAGELDAGIKINEDLLMNYFLFKKAERSVFEDFCPYRYIVRGASASRQKLNENKIFDPIKVKRIILDTAPECVAKAAEKAFISTCVNVFNSLAFTGKKEFVKEKKEVRTLIIDNWDKTRLLSKKQRAAALLIKALPGAYSGIYRIYSDKFRTSPYR